MSPKSTASRFTSRRAPTAALVLLALVMAQVASVPTASAGTRVLERVGAWKHRRGFAQDGVAVRRNAARYLADHAGALPSAPPESRTASPARHASELDCAMTNRDPQAGQALRVMEEIWQATRGYFPGRTMPVPLFSNTPGQDAGGAVGWVNGWGIGIRWGTVMTRQLLHPVDALSRDDALRVLLHEWAHNFQLPEYHTGPTVKVRSGHRVHPLAEGGAEAFTYAVAPLVARKLGRPYSQRIASLIGDDYRGFVVDVTLHRGMNWILRGQFGTPE